MSIQKLQEWRYATKQYNGKRVPDNELKTILESINLAPTSFGLQPLKVIHINQDKLSDAVKAAAYNQPQMSTLSDLVVFGYREEYSKDLITDYMQLVKEQRQLNDELIGQITNTITGAIESKVDGEFEKWSSRQAYIPLAQAILAAAELGVDSCPMEGFDPTAMKEALGDVLEGYFPVVMLSLGYRSDDDVTKDMPKVRKPLEELVVSL